ncbi:hypothetical protein CNBG_9303 [Cryptococcus deuterogattii R265]|uniref:uncharacterized protein n=1 Tax=Cryptococcus deuterogattii (strain R265) TaxID=294750 RepID=UPI0019367143|nr:hypothetical protein CNBG_9303 [Cryptococcus deuterogattii R265]
MSQKSSVPSSPPAPALDSPRIEGRKRIHFHTQHQTHPHSHPYRRTQPQRHPEATTMAPPPDANQRTCSTSKKLEKNPSYYGSVPSTPSSRVSAASPTRPASQAEYGY